MLTIGIPELAEDQIEQLCAIAEATARSHIYKMLSPKKIDRLDICATTEGTKPTTLSLEIELMPKLATEEIAAQRIINGAIKASFNAAEKYLRKIACQSPT